MSTAKTKAKLVSPQAARANEKLPTVKPVRATQQKQFAAAIDSIAKRYGVKVASASTPTKNPYSMSADQAAKVAFQAGIITRAGNLTRTFK